MKFGAIDIGTNAARLLVGEVEHEGGHSFVKKISYTRVPLRLGEEVFEDGKISKKKTEDLYLFLTGGGQMHTHTVIQQKASGSWELILKIKNTYPLRKKQQSGFYRNKTRKVKFLDCF